MQLDLARAMGVTDKAVSKWERDLSMPDVGSLPKLAVCLLGIGLACLALTLIAQTDGSRL